MGWSHLDQVDRQLANFVTREVRFQRLFRLINYFYTVSYTVFFEYYKRSHPPPHRWFLPAVLVEVRNGFVLQNSYVLFPPICFRERHGVRKPLPTLRLASG